MSLAASSVQRCHALMDSFTPLSNHLSEDFSPSDVSGLK